MASLFQTICSCGHKLQALALGIKDGKTQKIVDIIPKKCLHAWIELGREFRNKK